MRISIEVDVNDIVSVKEAAEFLDQYLQKHEETKMIFGKYQTMIINSSLPTRIKTVLRRNHYRTVGCLVRAFEDGTLSKTKNLGKSSLNIIADYLTGIGALREETH